MREERLNLCPKLCSERTAFWLREEETSDVFGEKIESAFRNVKSLPLKRIIFQFWRVINSPAAAGTKVLSCSSTPFALSPVNHRLLKYRLRSSLHYYAFTDCAPPAIAFFKHFPEVVLDLRVHKGTPLVDLALECELACCMMLPLFYEAVCVGVIEVSVRFPGHLLVILNELQREVKRVGLTIDRPKAISQPCKAIAGDLNLARSEVAEALKVVSKSHSITLGQVWVPCDINYGWIRGWLLGKLRSYCVVNSGSMSLAKHFYFYHDLCYLPLRRGPGLMWRTLETRKPHLCRNIYKLSDNMGLLAVLSAKNIKCTCFVICLRSSHTGELDYVFDFFWPQSRNHLALVEALSLTLRQQLPSFKYDSGAKLGDELLVIDVENPSSSSGCGSVKIFPGNESPEKRASVDMKRVTRASVGMKRVTRASVGMKRQFVEGQTELNQANQYPVDNINNPDDEDDDLVIRAVHKVDHSLFFLPSSPTFESLMEKINEEFDFNPAGTYKIEYQVHPGEWYSLTDDTCLKSCVSSYRASKNIDHIKLCVRQRSCKCLLWWWQKVWSLIWDVFV